MSKHVLVDEIVIPRLTNVLAALKTRPTALWSWVLSFVRNHITAATRQSPIIRACVMHTFTRVSFVSVLTAVFLALHGRPRDYGESPDTNIRQSPRREYRSKTKTTVLITATVLIYTHGDC